MSSQVRLIIGSAVIILVLGFGGFLLFTNRAKISGNDTALSQNLPESSPTAGNSAIGTLKSLLADGKNVSCQVSNPSQKSTGTVYVAPNKFRGDFAVTYEGKDSTSHMINSDGYMYLWSEGSVQGTKVKINLDEALTLASTQPQVTNLDQEVNLDCNPWTVDDSKFTLPTNIKFSDMSQLIMQSPSTSVASGSAIPKLDKSVCDMIQDPQAKASCLKTLGN